MDSRADQLASAGVITKVEFANDVVYESFPPQRDVTVTYKSGEQKTKTLFMSEYQKLKACVGLEPKR